MLSVPNRTNWEDFFSQSFISNCSVKIYDLSDNLLIDKENIEDFSLKLRNRYVCDVIPSYEGSFTILKWNSLSSSAKTYFSTKLNELKIGFVVENVETTAKYQFVIKKTKVATKNTTANVEFYIDFSGWAYDVVSYWSNGYLSSRDYTSMPIDMTKGMLAQYQNAKERKGIKLTNGYDTSGSYKSYTPSAVDGYFDGKNVGGDYEIYDEEEDKSNIVIYGVIDDSDNEDVLYDVTNSISGIYPTAQVSQSKMKPVVITSYSFYVSGGNATNNSIMTHNNYYITARYRTQSSATPSRLVVYGYEAKLDSPSNSSSTSNIPYIQTYALLKGSTALSNYQTYCRNYFANKNFIEFDCRIDPTIEPLDIIQSVVDNVVYTYAVEEVDINFNGGFKGRIKGRIILQNQAPVISNLNMHDMTFDVTNPNATAQNLYIQYSGGINFVGTINPNSTLHCDADSGNCGFLYDSFYDKNYGNLTTDVICWFGDSVSTMLLEADV